MQPLYIYTYQPITLYDSMTVAALKLLSQTIDNIKLRTNFSLGLCVKEMLDLTKENRGKEPKECCFMHALLGNRITNT